MQFHSKQNTSTLSTGHTEYCMASSIQSFRSLLVGRGSWKLKGLGVGQLEWFGEVNRVTLAQRRSVVDEGSEARVSAWAFRRSTMSWWEAPSATDSAVCPFWVKNRETVSVSHQRHCSDCSYPDSGSVVLLFLQQLDIIVHTHILHLPCYRQYYAVNITGRAGFSI